MIGKIKKGSFFSGVINYASKDNAELIDTNMPGMEKDFIEQMNECFRESSSESKKPVRHFILSFAPGDFTSPGPDREQLKDIAQEYLKGIGYDNNQQVSYLHKDRDHLHLHIIANQINFDLKYTKDSDSYRKGRKACMRIEEKYNLTRTPITSKKLDIKKEEIELKKRLKDKGELTVKQEVGNTINYLLKKTTNHDTFRNHELWERKGIKVKMNTGKNGYVFEKNGVRVKPSSISRNLSFSKLSEQFEKNDLLFKDIMKQCKTQAEVKQENPVFTVEGTKYQMRLNDYLKLCYFMEGNLSCGVEIDNKSKLKFHSQSKSKNNQIQSLVTLFPDAIKTAEKPVAQEKTQQSTTYKKSSAGVSKTVEQEDERDEQQRKNDFLER